MLSSLSLLLCLGLWAASYWNIYYEHGTRYWYKDKPARIRKVSCRLAQGQAKLVLGEFQAESYRDFQQRKAGDNSWVDKIYRKFFRVGEQDVQAPFSKREVGGFVSWYTQWRPFFIHKDDLFMLDVPLWVPTLLCAGAWWICFLAPRLRARRWQAAGRCLRCGYDLRASSGTCPECGHLQVSCAGTGR